MIFYIDAHLPKSLCDLFISKGYNALHTSELPNGNATSDQELIQIAGDHGVIITKDDDFYQSFLLFGRPKKLIHVKTGNLRLKETIELFTIIAPTIIQLLVQHDMLEVYADKLVVPRAS
jgi:predicted nuclease of predicted toxin-antitoxin system